MSNEEKERRCKACGKRLIDEKIPFCRRCLLEGRDKTAQVGGMFAGAVTTYFSFKAFKNSGKI